MENITHEQRALLERLSDADPDVEIRWDDERGVASSIRGRLGVSDSTEPEAVAVAFLDVYGPLVGPADLPRGLQLLRAERDDIGWDHLIYAYSVGDEIEVFGAKLAVHASGDRSVIDVESNLWRDLPPLELDPTVSVQALRERLVRGLESLPGYTELREAEGDQPDFPLTGPPRLVVYPADRGFRLAWAGFGYSAASERVGVPVETPYLAYGHIFVDARTGEPILFAPTRKYAETAATGTGTAVTPLTGGHATRTLHVVRIDNGNTYRLKDTTHNRDIITYDVACDSAYDLAPEIATALYKGSAPISEDTDGDHNWNRLPSDTTAAQRTAGQQPEVDAHHFARQQYEWYDALAGRIGWDNHPDPQPGQPPLPQVPLRILAHCRVFADCQAHNAYEDLYMDPQKTGGQWVCWLAFADGDHTTYDYMAGSRWLVAHEYQHAVTDWRFEDSSHKPGLAYTGWWAAVHEGLSDTFACLSSEDWRPARDIYLQTPAVDYRTIAYPRDTAAHNPGMLDHFDDRNTKTGQNGENYARGTILAHCAYLMGKGGVHERKARKAGAVLIPVPALGREKVGGVSVLKAARIWYRALDQHSSTVSNSDQSFRTLREGCVKAAETLYGKGSLEYCNTVLAFYAVGLQPTDQPVYGPDVTFLRWGVSWDLSRNYVGLTSPDYSSRDLFINNGGASEWNAIVNVIDPNTGQPTQYENNVYCRVRNVGDRDALNVKVTFDYAKAGTAIWKWQPVVDRHGVAQSLPVGTLTQGQSSFADSAQNSPPSAAAVKWCIPPLPAGEKVDHFCLRAKVNADRDVNPHNNEVQSNIAYTSYAPGKSAKMAFVCGNPPQLDRAIPLDLRVRSTLPERWQVGLRGVTQGEELRPGEERLFEVVIDMPPGADDALETPLDGDLRGIISEDTDRDFTGSLTDARLVSRSRVTGQFSGLADEIGSVCGVFTGTINLRTGWLSGTVDGPHPQEADRTIHAEIKARLRPWRRVEISQWADDELLGGVTVQVQGPSRRGRFGYRPPGTDVYVNTPS